MRMVSACRRLWFINPRTARGRAPDLPPSASVPREVPCPSAVSTMLRCDGDALPTTLAAGNYTAQVFGCALSSANPALLTFVLAVRRRGSRVSFNCDRCSGYAQEPLSKLHSAPLFALDGHLCSMAMLPSAVTLECALNRAKYQLVGLRVVLSMQE